MASTRQSMVALRMANSRYLVLLFCLLCVCRADSTTPSMNAADAHHAKHETIAKNTQIHGDNDTYQHILTRLESWMKEKRKNDKQRNQLYDDYDDDDDEDDSTTMARPFVTLAFAQTLDGMIAAKSTTDSDAVTSNLLLSCPQSTILTHHLRNVHDAILVGGSTFLADQPRLNVRLPSEQTPSGGVRHPIPIILDTNLKYLQRLIFGNNWEPSNDTTTNTPPEIMLENIRAHHPIICCSAIAAQAFLDILEISFQEDDDGPKRKRTKSYKIFVYKKIDDPHHGHKTDNNYMPIKITIHITTHHNNRHKHDDDDDANTKQDITLTLLPCRINKQTNSLDLRHVLSQLYNQVDIESVMVEGGAGVLSSFLNECVLGDSSRTRAGGKVVDCICVTISPQIIGGKWGLPVLGKFDIHPASDSKPERSDGECGIEEGGRMMLRQGVMSIKEGEFLSLGQDGTFLGRI